LIGTALYMSPEHLRSSRSVDARTDIWALGVVLYELLTGEAPFVSQNVGDLALEIDAGKYPPLRAKLPSAPQGLSDVIATCLERDREKRYASALDLAIALEPFADARDQTSVATIRHALHSPAPPRVSQAPPPSRRSLDVVLTAADEAVPQRRHFTVVLSLLLVLSGARGFASFAAWHFYSSRR
jgi:serine/threonine-protein kinase